MKTSAPVVIIMTSVLVLNACAKDRLEVEENPNYADYSPGYTGQSQGYDGYGDYDNGYGPSFWNPRYFFYTGYHHGYGNGSP